MSYISPQLPINISGGDEAKDLQRLAGEVIETDLPRQGVYPGVWTADLDIASAGFQYFNGGG